MNDGKETGRLSNSTFIPTFREGGFFPRTSKIAVLTIDVVSWPPIPPNMPFQRRRECIFHWRGRTWLTIWDRVKIPRYSHRLMHRKRVTCELHDSYYRAMTIKHGIPKTAEVMHSDGQLWGDIEWVIELLYNSLKTGSQLALGDQKSCRNDAVEKASTQQRAGPLGRRLSCTRVRERNAVMANRVGVNMLQFCSVSNSLSHTQLFQ